MPDIYKAGLTNKDTDDLGVLALAERRVSVNKCYSFTCAGPIDSGVWKLSVSHKINICPDCNSRLYPKSMLESKYISLINAKPRP